MTLDGMKIYHSVFLSSSAVLRVEVTLPRCFAIDDSLYSRQQHYSNNEKGKQNSYIGPNKPFFRNIGFPFLIQLINKFYTKVKVDTFIPGALFHKSELERGESD